MSNPDAVDKASTQDRPVVDEGTRQGAVAEAGSDTWPDAGFLAVPEPSAEVQALYDADLDELGFVMNLCGLWAHQPASQAGLFDLMGEVARGGSLSVRQRGILVLAAASTMGDSYCSLSWGTKLAGEIGAEPAGGILRGDDRLLDPSEQALARWARQVAGDPNRTDTGDVQALRDAGFDDAQIFAATLFVGLRMAFSTVNDALGARPDREVADAAPDPVREAVTFGRPVATGEQERPVG